MGISTGANNTINLLKKQISNIDSILFLGDMAFDLITFDGLNGNNFMKFINPITSQVPFMVS